MLIQVTVITGFCSHCLLLERSFHFTPRDRSEINSILYLPQATAESQNVYQW